MLRHLARLSVPLRRRSGALLAAALLAAALLAASPALGQPVTGAATPPRSAPAGAPARTAARVDLPEGHSPQGALWRAAAVPGWGQVYNRQYLKLPFVYGGLGGAVYLAVRLTDEYVLYRRATRFQQSVDPSAAAEEAYRTLLARFDVESIQEATLRAQRDNLRRNRDLSLLGVGLVYALTVLDAYVGAHLLDFDVGEDLTLAVAPAAAGVRVRLSL